MNSLAYLGKLAEDGVPLCTSLQVCSEFLVTLTLAPKVRGRPVHDSTIVATHGRPVC